MFFVLRMTFSTFFLPLCRVQSREEGIGFCQSVFHFRHVETVGMRERFRIEAGTSDDKYFLFVRTGFQGFFQCVETLGSFKLSAAAAQYDIPAVEHNTLGQGFKLFPSHDDGKSGGPRLEELQIVGEPVEQFVIMSDSPVLIDGYDNG